MRPWRVRLVSGVIAAIAGGHLFDLLTGKEHWPFSGYPMFARRQHDRTLAALRLFGVTHEEPPREIPLMVPEYIRPFDPSRLRVALGRLDSAEDRAERLREALNDVLERYEARRAAHRHDGPPIRGIRLYRLSWLVEPGARNLDRPDQRGLVFELVRPAT